MINGTKFTLVPDKGFQKAVRLYQAVTARSVEPRQILISSNNETLKIEGSNPTPHFFVKEIFLNIIIALRRLFYYTFGIF